MFWIMAAHFLLQIFQRFTQHISHNANAGYHKQKVRHGFHLLSTEVLRNSVQPAATQWSAFHCRQTKLNHIYCCPSILFHAIIETTISKGKKFSYSFICRKGYSPPFGGRIAFCLQSEPFSPESGFFHPAFPPFRKKCQKSIDRNCRMRYNIFCSD